MFGPQKNEPIYKHNFLDERLVAKVRPMMESAFANELKSYTGNRQQVLENRIDFAARQFANRLRIAEVSKTNPLNEDAKIFAGLGIKEMFESTSLPGNIIGMGNVSNPDSSNQHAGGMWNPGYKAGSGDIPSYVFGLQSHLAYHCTGFDLIPMINVDTPKIVLNYVDTVYGGGVFDDAEFLPTFIEISSKTLTGAFAKEQGLKRGTSEFIFREGTGDGKLALKVRFIMKQTVKAAYVVEVIGTGTVDAANVFTKTSTASVADVIKAINADVASSVVIEGTATTLVGKMVADYTSATRTNIAEATSNDNSRTGMSRAQHRKGSKHKLNVISLDKQLEVKGIEIEADTDNIQIKDMAAQGINVIARLYSGVQNALVQTLDEIILDHLFRLGVTAALNAYQASGQNHSLYISSPANVSKAMSDIDVEFVDILGNDVRADMGSIPNALLSTSYENQATHADRLFTRILLAAEFMAHQNRIGGPDFMVLGGTLAACLKKHSTYTISPVANTLTQTPELHYSGTIFGNIAVYKNGKAEFNDPRILLGRRGTDSDNGAKLLAYDLAASRQTLSEETMAEKIRVWSRFEIADVGFYPELNYYTLVAINDYQWA